MSELHCICCGKPITEYERWNNQGASVCDEHFGLIWHCIDGECPLRKEGKCQFYKNEEVNRLIASKAYKEEGER